MTSKQQRRRRILGVCFLLILLPGFPLVFIAGALLLGLAGFQEQAMALAVYASLFYYGFARIFLGESLIPLGMMGPNPTTMGYVLAAVFYALIALALSWLLFRLTRSRVSPDS